MNNKETSKVLQCINVFGYTAVRNMLRGINLMDRKRIKVFEQEK